ncbi:Serine/threonine-protein phosphatase 4 regulatory subunit 1 [Strongyloides ratti]|uniref:Serine/threonine-protein phosphatase 4 regulatory subunit 1 n=1 Tax=Strongyloides ratti TaxID=34506 RepID=A0A090LHA8_STRRB|nr:Serine/threonine-protein phosphatase 4 regulatory subunit 1 [Strongyloides ratti]CEF66865.1 Serine/threonine-protein phosphatase 4 regulatory subunit 1 [Strongyloides ratti]
MMNRDNDICYAILDEDSYDITGDSIRCVEDWFDAMENDLISEKASVMQSVLRVLRLLDVSESKADVERVIMKMREKSSEHDDVAKSCMMCLKALYGTYLHVDFLLNLLDSILLPEVVSFFFNSELRESSAIVLLELIENRFLSTEAIESTVVPGMFSFLKHFIFSKNKGGHLPPEAGSTKAIYNASHIITKVIEQIDRFSDKWVAEEFLPQFSTMLGQRDPSIRKICLQSTKTLSNLFGITFTEQCLCPYLLSAADDCDWSIRKTACEIFPDITKNVTKNFKKKHLVEMFINLTKDGNECVAQIAFQQMSAFIDAFIDNGETDVNSKYTLTTVFPPRNDFLLKTGLQVRFYIPNCHSIINDISKYPIFGAFSGEKVNSSDTSSLEKTFTLLDEDERSYQLCLLYDNVNTCSLDNIKKKTGNGEIELIKMMKNLKLKEGLITENNINEKNDEIIIRSLLEELIEVVVKDEFNYKFQMKDDSDTENNFGVYDMEENTKELYSKSVEEYDAFVESFDVATKYRQNRSSGYFNVYGVSDAISLEDSESMFNNLSDKETSIDDEYSSFYLESLSNTIERAVEVAKYLNKDEINYIKTLPELPIPKCILKLYLGVEIIGKYAKGAWIIRCAETIVKILKIIGRENWPLLKGVYFFLLYDVGERVSRILAENIGELAEILCPQLEDDVIRVYDNLRTCDYETQSILISNISQLVKMLSCKGQNKVCRELHHFGIRNVDSSHRYKWRNRDVYMQECCNMVDYVSLETVNDYFVPSAMSLATDQIAQVRHSATNLLSRIFIKFIISELMIAEQNNESCTDSSDMPLTDGLLTDLRVGFRKSIDWKKRQVYMKFCEFVLNDSSVPSEFIHSTLWKDISILAKDHVINVRIILSRIIKNSSSFVWSMNNDLIKDVERTVNSRHLFEYDPQLKSEMRTINNNLLIDEWDFLKERRERIIDQQNKFYEHMALLKCGFPDPYGIKLDNTGFSADNSDMEISDESNA